MLKVWNVSLICATFALALLGTFLVRSGILDSIHAFGASTIGVQFLVFIGLVIALSAGADRRAAARPALARRGSTRCSRARRSSCSTTSCWSALCLVIMWGTFFPLISEAITGTEASVGPPWFDRLTTPLALVLVLLTGHRADAGLAARDARRRCGACCACPWRSPGVDARGCCSRSRTRPRAPVAADVPLRRVRARGRGAGVLARRGRAPHDDRRVVAAGAGAADRAQPAPLRRLPRARRDRGAVPRRGGVVGVRASSATCALSPGQTRHGGRLPGDLPPGRPRSWAATAPAPARRSRSGAVLDVRAEGKHFMMRPSRNYYATTDPSLGRDLALLRGRGHQRGRRALGPAAATSGWRSGRTSARSQEPIREADRKFADSPADVQAVIIARAGRAATGATRRRRRSGRSCRRWCCGSGSAAAIVVLGALRGRVALARGAAAPGALALLGPAGPRALARVDARGVRARPAGPGGVVAAVLSARPLRRRGEEERREETRIAELRGREGGEVPRDPRRRAGPPDGQAVPRGLARGRPRPARRGDRDPARARPAGGPLPQGGGMDR